MTEDKKVRILRLIDSGLSYSEIAMQLDETVDSIKSVVKRRKQIYGVKCLNCGVELKQPLHHFPRIYCCRKCAFGYRNKIRILEKTEKKVCEHCGSVFTMNQILSKDSAQESALGCIVMENKEYRAAVEKYTIATKSAKGLLESGTIDQEDYQKIDEQMRKKYGIKKGTILTLI